MWSFDLNEFYFYEKDIEYYHVFQQTMNEQGLSDLKLSWYVLSLVHLYYFLEIKIRAQPVIIDLSDNEKKTVLYKNLFVWKSYTFWNYLNNFLSIYLITLIWNLSFLFGNVYELK